MRRASLAPLLAALATGLAPATGTPASVRAQGGPPGALADRQEPVAEIRALLDGARAAQRDFERRRRRSFPRGVFAHGRCDEHIGRFCLTHDGDDEWGPTPEPSDVIEARRGLLATLDSVAALLPGNDWILGQRVAYRIEAGSSDAALSVARVCGATRWWCAALEGLALHSGGRTVEAETAFGAALAALPADEACRWRDVAYLLDGNDRDRYEDLPCGSAEREAAERTVWLLSDALWSEPGFERRAEHLARRTRIEIQTDAASGYGVPWGRDLDELTVRYGWPEGWDVAWRRDPGLRTERAVQAHRSPDAQRLVPDGLLDSDEAPVWRLDDEKPRSAWAPPTGPIDDTLDPQIAVFRRGGRRLVIAVLEPGSCARRAWLHIADRGSVVAAGEGNGRVVRVLEPAGRRARWAGVETRCEDRPGAVRARLRLPLGSTWMSDILLFEPGQTLPGTLDATLGAVRGSNRVRPGEALGVFWEWYGPPEPQSVTVELTREDRNFLRKALEWTGLADRRIDRAGVRWLDPGAEEDRGRAIRIELPDLAPGRYRLTLQVQSARVGRVLATREIVVGG